MAKGLASSPLALRGFGGGSDGLIPCNIEQMMAKGHKD